MTTSDQIDQIAVAMAKAQHNMKPAVKDSTNPHFRSKYSDFTSVWAACREPLTINGLSVWQDVTLAERGVSVVTRIAHISGQWVEFGPLTVPLAKVDAHGVGSATTYAKRYAFCAAVGIVADEDDDDGNEAIKAPAQAATSTQPQAPDRYDDWLMDFESVALEGIAALEEAWLSAHPSMKKHLKATDPDRLERIKHKASQVELPQ